MQHLYFPKPEGHPIFYQIHISKLTPSPLPLSLLQFCCNLHASYIHCQNTTSSEQTLSWACTNLNPNSCFGDTWLFLNICAWLASFRIVKTASTDIKHPLNTKHHSVTPICGLLGQYYCDKLHFWKLLVHEASGEPYLSNTIIADHI